MAEDIVSVSLPEADVSDLIEMLDERAEFLEITAVYHLEGGDDEDEEFVAYAEALPYGFHDYMDSVVANVNNGSEAMRFAKRIREMQERLVSALGG